jgi:predicted Zn-dependent protease
VAASPQFAQGHYGLGVLWLSAGDVRQAAMHLERAVALEPNHVEARVTLGDILRTTKRFAPALVHYQRARSAAPAEAAAVFGEVLTLVALGRTADARDELRLAVTTHPGNPVFPRLLAQVNSGIAIDTGILYDGAR